MLDHHDRVRPRRGNLGRIERRAICAAPTVRLESKKRKVLGTFATDMIRPQVAVPNPDS